MKSFKAESLIETIIAVTVVTITSMAAYKVTSANLLSNEALGEKTIALSMAKEGIEAVKNIRDTNYLRFASDTDECWNTLSATKAGDCATSTKISSGTTYYLYRDLTKNYYSWMLKPTTAKNTGQMYLYAMDADHKLYAQYEKGSTYTSTASIYSRTLTVSNASTDQFDVTVTVSWTQAGVSKSISLSRPIANVY